MALALPGAVNASKPKSDFKVSVCDWMILKRQKIGEFQLASQLGYDGVEVDMGSLGNREQFDNKLREEEFQKLFRDKAAEFGVEISSIAMSGFYGQSFAARDNYRSLTEDCLATMEAMGVKVAFLPLGTGCDLTKNPEVRPELVKRLREVGDLAAARGLVIGIETSLDAAGEKALLKEIGSKGIKIYYKFQNALENGRDINSELKRLGRKRICQIHCTDTDGVTLRHNSRLDLPSILHTLRKMRWSGWLVVERSRNKEDVRNVKANYGDNAAYLKEIIK
jgi:sugar phosphate isomerase/epimerase